MQIKTTITNTNLQCNQSTTKDLIVSHNTVDNLYKFKCEIRVPVSVCPGSILDLWMHYMCTAERSCNRNNTYLIFQLPHILA